MWERMPGTSWDRAAGIGACTPTCGPIPKEAALPGAGIRAEHRVGRRPRGHLVRPEGWEGSSTAGSRLRAGSEQQVRREPRPVVAGRRAVRASWIDANDADHSTLSFLRTDHAGNTLACIVNFSGGPLHDYRIGLPSGGRWAEVVNTDAVDYEGSGVGNLGGVRAEEQGHHGRPYSATVAVGPRATVWLRHEG